MTPRSHSILISEADCVACIDCSKACPTKAIRVPERTAVVNGDLCIDCGACIRACRFKAVRAQTSSSSDLKRFKYTVALPSLTLYAQFGRDIHPEQVLAGLKEIGFDDTYDISWMCEMLAGATDAFLSECDGPWPKISVTCPAIVRLVQIRYPDLIDNLIPVEVSRELAAKLLRRKLAAEKGLAPDEIGLFFITPCSAIMNSIVDPVGLEQSYLDGAISISEIYGPLLHAIKKLGPVEPTGRISPRGLLWAMSGGRDRRDAQREHHGGPRRARRPVRLRPHRGGQVPERRLHRGLHLPRRLRQRPARDRGPIRRPAEHHGDRRPSRQSAAREGGEGPFAPARALLRPGGGDHRPRLSPSDPRSARGDPA